MENSENQEKSPLKDEIVLNQLVDLILIGLQSTRHDPDPFAEYVNTLRNRFQDKNPQAFRAKFIKGYQILLKTVTIND